MIYRNSKTQNSQLLNNKLDFKCNELYNMAVRMLEQKDTRGGHGGTSEPSSWQDLW